MSELTITDGVIRCARLTIRAHCDTCGQEEVPSMLSVFTQDNKSWAMYTLPQGWISWQEWDYCSVECFDVRSVREMNEQEVNA